jgi:hypothetical protein
MQQRSSWRWFLHRRWTNRSTSEMVPEVPKLPNLGSNKPDTPRGKFPNASARRSNCFPFRPNGVTIRSQGTKAPVKTLEARDRRSPLTTRRMSRIAKGSLLQGPLFSKTSARADSQKRRSRPPSRIATRALKCAAGVVEADGMGNHRHRCRGRWGLCAETENPSCETLLRLITHIAAPSFKKLAKDC